ncbi:DUF4097 family beta strand repeat-containing protein [Pseudarthrobacter sp. J1763]|uniref:DUF4097 family beta strand repeat-containing protein n=1 Tax=Pseudarthrobacter sp. J1763 TaxID=3420445 RepID=UPI003D297F2E
MAQEVWSVTGPQIIDLSGVTSLKLGIVAGRFDVVAQAANEGEDFQEPARIEVSEVVGDPLAITFEDGRLEIRHQIQGAPGWFKNLMTSVTNNNDNRAVITISVPAQTTVEAGTVSGDGLVQGTTKITKLNTVSGSVVADATSGELNVNTVSGEVIIRRHNGLLSAKSVSGEVTASGELSHVRASTVSGELSLDLLGYTQDVGTNSVSGDVTIRLPHDLGVDISANTASGTVIINHQKYVPSSGRVRTIAGPDLQLVTMRTNSVSGHLTILHRAEAETHAQETLPSIGEALEGQQ